MGQNNDVLIVNESLIFRFPRYRQGDRRVATRAAVWPHHGASLPRLVTTRAAAEIIAPLGIARANYAKLIATWAQWEGVSRQAQG